jgi:hypothetical protein
MSSDSDKGSGGKNDDMFDAILMQLTAMYDRLRSMEAKLHNVDIMQDKVSTLEASTGELGAQQDTLSLAVERIDLAQTQLAARVGHGDTVPHNPPHGRPAHAGRRRHGEDDDNVGDDIVPRTHKIEFPKYDGTGDPLLWLNRCERYFHVRRTPERKRVVLAACYLLDNAQLWFHRMELNGGRPSWPQFIQLVNARFIPPLTDTPLGELAMLRRSSSIDEFAKRFMALSCRDPSITESQQIQLFIIGLGDPLCLDIALQQPPSMDDVVIFTRAYEQRLATHEADPQPSTRGVGHASARTTSLPGATSAPAHARLPATSTTKPSSILRLLPGTPLMAIRPYRYAQHQKHELERQCSDMLRHRAIRASSSAFATPVLLVKKGDSSCRFCVDYRALNVVTVKDKFLIPIVEELLDELRGTKFFSKLDLRSSYHQVRMDPTDIEKTVFQTHKGLFEFLVMLFGLTNGPATIQALMNDVLCPFLRQFVLVCFDNILVYSSSWEEHLRHLYLVFIKL